jgi:hypothetical protein
MRNRTSGGRDVNWTGPPAPEPEPEEPAAKGMSSSAATAPSRGLSPTCLGSGKAAAADGKRSIHRSRPSCRLLRRGPAGYNGRPEFVRKEKKEKKKEII